MTPQKGLTSLKGEAEFRKVRKAPAIRTPYFSLRKIPYRPKYGEPHQPRAIIGIVVSRKTLRKAVERNKIRRRTKEALRLIQPSPCKAVLVLEAQCLTTPFEELKNALEVAFAQPFRPISKR